MSSQDDKAIEPSVLTPAQTSLFLHLLSLPQTHYFSICSLLPRVQFRLVTSFFFFWPSSMQAGDEASSSLGMDALLLNTWVYWGSLESAEQINVIRSQSALKKTQSPLYIGLYWCVCTCTCNIARASLSMHMCVYMLALGAIRGYKYLTWTSSGSDLFSHQTSEALQMWCVHHSSVLHDWPINCFLLSLRASLLHNTDTHCAIFHPFIWTNAKCACKQESIESDRVEVDVKWTECVCTSTAAARCLIRGKSGLRKNQSCCWPSLFAAPGVSRAPGH